MRGRKNDDGKYMGSVKVGPKGQIVIPKEIRDMFEIDSGDTLIILADAKKGIAIERISFFSKIADRIFAGGAEEIYPEHEKEDTIRFAEGIKRLSDESEEE